MQRTKLSDILVPMISYPLACLMELQVSYQILPVLGQSPESRT